MGRVRGRQHRGEAAWRELLRRFGEGDETVEAFCQREGLSKSTFNRWRRLGGGQRKATPAAAAPKANQASGRRQAGFVDLGALCAPSAGAGRLELTLELGGGVTLRVVRG